MSIDLAYDDAQQAIVFSLEQFCAEHCADGRVRTADGDLPDGLWPALADLGVLATATPAGEGGPVELCAAMEALGYGVCPGPWFATVLAGQLLDGAELAAVVEGRKLVAAGSGPLFAWGARAELFLVRRGDDVCRGTPTAAPEATATLGGSHWARVALALGPALPNSARAGCIADTAHAAYLSSAARRLLDTASRHARDRKQFGRAIGEFQAVAHPLADCAMSLDAARTLARAAAHALECDARSLAASRAAAARLSAEAAARRVVQVAHQVLGAIGITTEGPAFHISRQLQQLVAAPGQDGLRERVLANFAASGASA